MSQFELNISIRWWRSDKKRARKQDKETLQANAVRRVRKCVLGGMTCGGLDETIYPDDVGAHKPIVYRGWWEIAEKKAEPRGRR